MNRKAKEIQLDRFFVDPDLGVSFFVVIGTLDRLKMGPGVALAPRFISSLESSLVVVLYRFQVNPIFSNLRRERADGAGEGMRFVE